MTKIIWIFRLLLCMTWLLLTSCSNDTFPSRNIVLSQETSTQQSIKSNHNLTLFISDKFENPALIGGNNSYTDIHFQDVIPWIKNRLSRVDSFGCTLKKKTNLTISVKKLFVYADAGTTIFVLVLHGKISTNDGKILIQNYRGDCSNNFFSFDGIEETTKKCLNTSLDSIIINLKSDICTIQK